VRIPVANAAGQHLLHSPIVEWRIEKGEDPDHPVVLVASVQTGNGIPISGGYTGTSTMAFPTSRATAQQLAEELGKFLTG
jgi:hypothetical protein